MKRILSFVLWFGMFTPAFTQSVAFICIEHHQADRENPPVHPFTYAASNAVFDTFFSHGLVATEVPILALPQTEDSDCRIPAGSLEQETDFSVSFCFAYGAEKTFDSQQKASFITIKEITWILRDKTNKVLFNETVHISRKSKHPYADTVDCVQTAAKTVCEYVKKKHKGQ